MSKRRKRYKFSGSVRRERERLSGQRCEYCGKSATLQKHHLVPIHFAQHNLALTPEIIKNIVNCQSLCVECHQKANAHQYEMTLVDMAFLAWALFDIDPQIVIQSHKLEVRRTSEDAFLFSHQSSSLAIR